MSSEIRMSLPHLLNLSAVMPPTFFHSDHPPCGLTCRSTGHFSPLLEDAAPDSLSLSTTALGDFNGYLELPPVSCILSYNDLTFHPPQLPSMLYIMSLHTTTLLPVAQHQASHSLSSICYPGSFPLVPQLQQFTESI